MDKHNHSWADSDETGDWLTDLVKKALENLEQNSLDPSEVGRFLRETTETCSRLQDQIEALTVAKVGLEAILSAYESRYGDEADRNQDVLLFKKILAEKEELLAQLEAGLKDQAGKVDDFLIHLDNHRVGLEEDLSRFEEALGIVRDSHQEVWRRMDSDRIKIKAVKERYWSDNGRSRGEPERISLSKETLHQVVDKVLDRMTSDQKIRSELIGQVLTSVKDQDLKAVLSQKIGPSLDELPEVSDDEFWEG